MIHFYYIRINKLYSHTYKSLVYHCLHLLLSLSLYLSLSRAKVDTIETLITTQPFTLKREAETEGKRPQGIEARDASRRRIKTSLRRDKNKERKKKKRTKKQERKKEVATRGSKGDKSHDKNDMREKHSLTAKSR